MGPSCVELRIHGYPALIIDGVAAPLKLKRGLALLAHLAELGRKLARTQAAVMLWPDADESLGRTRLRRMVHQLNEVAGFELVSGDADSLWIAAPSDSFSIDIATTRRCAHELLATLPASVAEAGVRALLDPCAHLLLDGFTLDVEPFDDWLALRRCEHERLVARALHRLADHLTAAGEVGTAIEAAQRLIALDPLAEAGHAALIGAHGRAGDAAAVEAAYFTCAEMLRAEFGTRPSPMVEAAYERACTAARSGLPAASAPPPLPRIRFAPTSGGSVAYVEHGAGPETLIIVPGTLSHVEIALEEPRIARAIDWFAERYRVVLLDRRGTGLSERIGVPPTPEAAVEDIVAVMDHMGAARAWLLGSAACGAVAIEAAATKPERIAGLALVGANPRGAWAPDYPWALTTEQMNKWIAVIQSGWGDPTSLRTFAPTAADDPQVQAWWARMLRHAVSPNGIATLIRAFHTVDVRHRLPGLRLPVIVIQREGDRAIRAGTGRYLASQIPRAELVMLPGEDHFFWHGDTQAVLDAIERFIARASRPPSPG